MAGAMGVEMNKAVFLGTRANGQPLGVTAGAVTYGITATAIDATATWGVFHAAATRFMVASAAGSPSAVSALLTTSAGPGGSGHDARPVL
jgi:hypothetical protein